MTPVATYICPTRRTVVAYNNFPINMNGVPGFCNVALPIPVAARSDYATCVGDESLWSTDSGPTTLQYGDTRTDAQWALKYYGSAGIGPSGFDETPTGVCYRRSMVRLRDVKDGLSNTYLVGERNINSDHYFDGMAIPCDDQSWNSSFCFDVIRWTGTRSATDLGHADDRLQPRPDTPGYNNEKIFGSAHAGSFSMVFCDGSVQAISYSIDPETHHRLGNIADGLPVDAKTF